MSNNKLDIVKSTYDGAVIVVVPEGYRFTKYIKRFFTADIIILSPLDDKQDDIKIKV